MTTTTLKIELYGGLKDYFPAEMLLDWYEGLTVDELFKQLADQNPASIALLDKCAAAINQTICKRNRVIGEGDRISILPPYSGG